MSDLLDPVDVLQSARSLALRVMDKNIGPLSEQARELLGDINECLGGLPTVEEVQAIYRAAHSQSEPKVTGMDRHGDALPPKPSKDEEPEPVAEFGGAPLFESARFVCAICRRDLIRTGVGNVLGCPVHGSRGIER